MYVKNGDEGMAYNRIVISSIDVMSYLYIVINVLLSHRYDYERSSPSCCNPSLSKIRTDDEYDNTSDGRGLLFTSETAAGPAEVAGRISPTNTFFRPIRLDIRVFN